ncbi:hypothetical protein TsocGM_24040, partial [Tautonia sociabilis]
MLARRPRSPARRRRGVVLILVLSMLGLLAIIGVSFATFSGQAKSAALYYSTKLNRPPADQLIQYAIRQLINDTTNPMSALYGHGLKRDMYGNDAADNGIYNLNPDGSFPTITAVTPVSTGGVAPASWDIATNVPIYAGYNFEGWILTIPGLGATVAQTFEVAAVTTNGSTFSFRITGSHRPNTTHQGVGLRAPTVNSVFSLDGRFRHAFNGTGTAAFRTNVEAAMNGPDGLPGTADDDPGNRNPGQFANFRVSGGLLLGDPNYRPVPFNVNLLAADEDYDAPDLENWFLAVQSADGNTVIPSFHRPGILAVDNNPVSPTYGLTDMNVPHPSTLTPGTAQYRRAVRAISKILRPRPVDHPTAGFSDLTPDATTGKIEYDVDNDGDGITDSVWLDVGFPVQRSTDGRLYKPLAAFMVLGLNGRLPLNTAGNLNARLPVDDPNTPNFDEAGLPLFDHASHLGFSPSEINPKYALQNEYDEYFDPNTGLNVPDDAKPLNSQFDNATYAGVRHISVSLTQLRNLLTGTRPNPNNDSGEQNVVRVDGNPVRFQNNVTDPADLAILGGGATAVDRSNSDRVAGRWGEADALPDDLRVFPYDPATDVISPALHRSLNFSATRVTMGIMGSAGGAILPNPVRPGQSPYPDGRYLVDGIDDNLDSYDFYPPYTTRQGSLSASGPEAAPIDSSTTPPGIISFRSDARDASNMPMLTSERIRRFVTPIDPIGIGQVTRYDRAPVIRPLATDPIVPFDIGPDDRGRVGFLHYFRPPGVPLDVDDASTVDVVSRNPATERLIPNAGGPQDPLYPLAANRHNISHGFAALSNPAGAHGHLMAAMPFDLSNNGGTPRDAAGVVNPPTDLYAASGGTTDYIGTFSETINANPNGRLRRDPNGFLNAMGSQATLATTSTTGVHTYPLGSPLFNDPNEMNLYWPDESDAPFGPKDLEWLYRVQDVDGDALESRLSQLAAVSFVHAADAQTRRRLFSVESWDRIDYAFAHDNPDPWDRVTNTPLPAGSYYDLSQPPGSQPTGLAPPYLAPADPARVFPDRTVPGNPFDDPRQSLPQLNARFPGRSTFATSASLREIGGTFEEGGNAANRRGASSPSVIHGGRRINLNHPLPHSYDPFEPVRQKWISETYQTLKLILPPHAIDSPQELAKLGQFVVNIVDFRDPDNAITIWDNPDVMHLPAFRITTSNLDVPPSIHLPYRADGTVDPLYSGYDTDGDGNPDVLPSPLRHYGMEYQPVALNEVLAFQFNYSDKNVTGAPTDRNKRANRMYIELANLLTKAGPGTTDATDLNLQGWDFVLVKEDPNSPYNPSEASFDPVYVRPDPTTGQLPPVANVIAPVLGDDELSAPAAQRRVEPVLVGSGKKATRTDDGSGNLDLAPYQADYRSSALNPVIPAIQPDGDLRPGGGGAANRVYAMGGIKMENPTGYTKADVDLIADNLGDSNPTTWPEIDKDFDEAGGTYTPNSWDLIPPHDDPAFDQADPTARPEGLYFWLYLRRPANPLLPPGPGNPMVVVDSIRFPFSVSDGVGETIDIGGGQKIDRTTGGGNAPTQPLYSMGRPQPLRGGQLVPDPEATDQPLFLYGSSDQARPSEDSPDNTRTYYNSPDANDTPTPPP